MQQPVECADLLSERGEQVVDGGVDVELSERAVCLVPRGALDEGSFEQNTLSLQQLAALLDDRGVTDVVGGLDVLT
ncbi:hypothetical protein [Microbacterium suwonense]|uniref:hypothetical protein n=1 Tax=Microbacterium suwonense TaxID=683047 RepID=UPI00367078F0